jgi:hypothetical protein
VSYPIYVLLPCPNLNKRARDIANHMMQESIGSNINDNVSPLAIYAYISNVAKWRFTLAKRCAERGKVLLA